VRVARVALEGQQTPDMIGYRIMYNRENLYEKPFCRVPSQTDEE
jgi:hypothetical protein